MAGYIPNWLANPPSAEQLQRYSHVIISFASSTSWVPDKSPAGGSHKCSETCKLADSSGLGFNGEDLGKTVKTIKAGATPPKVLLSFGGSGQGEWLEGATTCWEFCWDKIVPLAKGLADMVEKTGLDGIDIDYEYFLNSTNFESSDFLIGLTKRLRELLPTKLITHSPRQQSVDPVGNPHYQDGGGYFNVTKWIAGDIDHLFIQFYNGYPAPVPQTDASNPDGIRKTADILSGLANGPFKEHGMFSKLVVGMLVGTGFSGFAKAPQVFDSCMNLSALAPDFGGLALWDSLECEAAKNTNCTSTQDPAHPRPNC